jgi:hypothetical protein
VTYPIFTCSCVPTSNVVLSLSKTINIRLTNASFYECHLGYCHLALFKISRKITVDVK